MNSEHKCDSVSDLVAHLTEMVNCGYQAHINNSGCIVVTNQLGNTFTLDQAIYFHITGCSPIGVHLYTRAKEIGMSEYFARQIQDTGYSGGICAPAHSSGLRKEILEVFKLKETHGVT